jgi:hypothetical protein
MHVPHLWSTQQGYSLRQFIFSMLSYSFEASTFSPFLNPQRSFVQLRQLVPKLKRRRGPNDYRTAMRDVTAKFQHQYEHTSFLFIEESRIIIILPECFLIFRVV